jgi:hypothetical protein
MSYTASCTGPASARLNRKVVEGLKGLGTGANRRVAMAASGTAEVLLWMAGRIAVQSVIVDRRHEEPGVVLHRERFRMRYSTVTPDRNRVAELRVLGPEDLEIGEVLFSGGIPGQHTGPGPQQSRQGAAGAMLSSLKPVITSLAQLPSSMLAMTRNSVVYWAAPSPWVGHHDSGNTLPRRQPVHGRGHPLPWASRICTVYEFSLRSAGRCHARYDGKRTYTQPPWSSGTSVTAVMVAVRR